MVRMQAFIYVYFIGFIDSVGWTGKTLAEKFLKWTEDTLTAKDMLINKLLMKNHAYKVAIDKSKKLLKTKQEAGEDLHYIDFHQLQIENQQVCWIHIHVYD